MIKKYNQFVDKINESEHITDEIQDIEQNSSFEQEEEEQEEEGGDRFESKLEEISERLGVEKSGNHIMYKGIKILHPSETGKFHAGRKKFNTVDELINYLETKDEFKNESKSYKTSRNFRK